MSGDKLKCGHCGQAIPQAGGIIADPDRAEIRHAGFVAYLTMTEFEMFRFMLERIGRVISKDSFLSRLYQLVDDEPEAKIVDVFICKMRRKLRGTGVEIKNHWGRGYSLEVPPPQANEEANVTDLESAEAPA